MIALAMFQVMVGATVGAVHYEGLTTTSSFAVSPAIRFERHGFAVEASSGYTSGSDGGHAFDGAGTLFLSSPSTSTHLQVDGLLQGSLIAPQGDSTSSELLGLGEVAWALADHGIAAGIGAVRGAIQGTAAATALRTELRGWYGLGDVTLTASVEPTRLSGSWFVEYAGGVERAFGPFDLSGSIRLRQVPGAASNLGGSGSVSWDATQRLTAELDGGRYLRDPYQGLPAGYFVGLAVRYKIAFLRGGVGEGVGAASLGDVSVRAASSSLGFGTHGKSRTVSQLPGKSGTSSGRGHKPELP